jgi:hypothetical protein
MLAVMHSVQVLLKLCLPLKRGHEIVLLLTVKYLTWNCVQSDNAKKSKLNIERNNSSNNDCSLQLDEF